MPEWEKIVLYLIPVYCLVYVFLFGLGLQYFYRKRLASKSADTKDWISGQMGLIVYICGQIGAGKTTLGGGLVNTLTLVLQEKAQKTLQHVIDCLPDVDFNLVDREIRAAFFSGLTNADAICGYLVQDIPSLFPHLAGFYYDYLNPVTKMSLLKDYVKARIALLRNNYVYFNLRKFYCWFTDDYAMNYDPSMLKIKERHETKDYKGQSYSVFFEDEKILSGTDSLHSSDVSKEDGGKSEFFRTIRHFGHGTMYYITTCQDFGRDVKLERELATDILYVNQRKEVPCFSFRYVGVSISYQLNQVFSGFRSYFLGVKRKTRIDGLRKRISFLSSQGKDISVEKKESESLESDPSLEPSWIRNWSSRINRSMEKIFADQFIRYRCSRWLSSSDFDKKLDPLPVEFCFPLSFCYGSIDTYAFSFLGDQLSAESIASQDWYDPFDHSVPPFDPDEREKLTDEILHRRVKGQGKNLGGSAIPLDRMDSFLKRAKPVLSMERGAQSTIRKAVA